MTWLEYLEQRIKCGASPDLAEIAVWHMMEIENVRDWNAEVPEDML